MDLKELPNKIRFHRNDKRKSGVQGKDIFKPTAPTMDTLDNHPKWVLSVFTQTNGTNTQVKYMPKTLVRTHSLYPRSSKTRKGGTGHLTKTDQTAYSLDTSNAQAIELIPGISGQLSLAKSPTLTSSAEGSPVKHFPLLESEGDLTTPEGLCFLKSLGFLPTKDPDILYSKTSKVYLVMTKEKLSRQYLGFSPTWGMSINGKFLTAKISESPRIGKECSLSDIDEGLNDLMYFL